MRQMKHAFPFVMVAILLGVGIVTGPFVAREVAYAVAVGQGEADRAKLAELSKHDQLSELFRTVARAVTPAVVEVHVKKRVKVPAVPGPFMDDDFLRRFFGDRDPLRRQPGPAPKEREFFSRGLGSGVVVDRANGYILTNHHVVGGADEVEVVLADKRRIDATWIRSDPQTDVAVIKVAPQRLLDAPLGDSDKMDVGDWVLAIGAPEALSQTVTAGIISAKGRTTDPGMYQNFLQTDAAINQGNSGGPLVNMRGEVIGINTAIISRTGVNEGLGLAIPSNMARRVMQQLIDKGKVVRGFLGVSIQNVDEKLAKSFKLPHAKGALVAQVMKDTPAEKAGIKAEDFIVSVDGKPVADVNELRNLVAGVEPGRTVDVELYRDGKKETVKVKVEVQPADMLAAVGPGREGQGVQAEAFGLKVETLTDEMAEKLGYKKATRGVLVTDVKSGSDAAEQGIRPGMLIIGVQGKDVKTAEEFTRAVGEKEAREGIRLRVTDNRGGQRFVFITPQK